MPPEAIKPAATVTKRAGNPLAKFRHDERRRITAALPGRSIPSVASRVRPECIRDQPIVAFESGRVSMTARASSWGLRVYQEDDALPSPREYHWWISRISDGMTAIICWRVSP